MNKTIISIKLFNLCSLKCSSLPLYILQNVLNTKQHCQPYLIQNLHLKAQKTHRACRSKGLKHTNTQNPYATADQMPLQASCCTRAAKLWAGAAQARIPFDRVETWKESRSRWLQDWWASPAVFQHLLFTSRWAKHSLTRHNMWIPLHCFCCCQSAGKPLRPTPPPPFRQPGS